MFRVYGLTGLIPVVTSQKLLGDTGDFVMFTFVMVAVVTTVSGEVLSVASILLYDIYQTYIAPFEYVDVNYFASVYGTFQLLKRDISPRLCIISCCDKNQIHGHIIVTSQDYVLCFSSSNTITKEIDGTTTIRAKRQRKNEEFLVYNKRCLILRYAVVTCSTVLLIPVTFVIMAIDIDLPWLFKALAVVVGSSVLPVVLAITWHRVTSVGMMSGVLVGLPAALLSWLTYASQLDGGLTQFRQNTNDATAVLIGSGVALATGGLLCIFVSLFTGGCRGDLMEDEVWEKTRKVDNPVLPWTVRYAPDIGAHQMVKGRPHFYTVRRTFKAAEICAYIFGVLFSVVVVLVWPACMLLVDVMNESAFESWTHVVLTVGVLATVYVTLVPLTWEIIQTGRQVSYNNCMLSHMILMLFTESWDPAKGRPKAQDFYAHP